MMSVNIVRAVMTSPNSISGFFAKPKQPLPEIVNKVIESIQLLIDHKFHMVCVFDGLAPLLKVEGAHVNRYGSHVKYWDNLEQMYQKAQDKEYHTAQEISQAYDKVTDLQKKLLKARSDIVCAVKFQLEEILCLIFSTLKTVRATTIS